MRPESRLPLYVESKEMDVKESNNERKRKRDEEGNGEEDDDA